jgi:hypothetical protein
LCAHHPKMFSLFLLVFWRSGPHLRQRRGNRCSLIVQLMRVPFPLWDALAAVAEMLPQPPLTRNQVELMQIDTTASEKLSGFRALGISPRSLEDESK